MRWIRFASLGIILDSLSQEIILVNMDLLIISRRKDMENKKLQRKATPFLQAMSDLNYCSLKEKQDILIEELFAHRG